MQRHVLVIFPHPDDESFGASGTIAQFREQGVPVTYLCGTLGEMGRNMGNPIFANRENLYTFRKQELFEAAKKLDIQVEMLGYRDKTLEFEPQKEVSERIRSYIDTLKPNLIITHYPGYAVHPDHNALGAAVMEAVRTMDSNEQLEVWAHAISNQHEDELGPPDVVHDVTPYWEQKLNAIETHLSQASGMMSLLKDSQKDDTQTSEQLERLRTERYYRLSIKK
ncbi:bacillithiol biosynthesis deacetylase BshB2 [Thalassobacillus sp. CUG 92003]|uniref:bacillithiol biosynthesis deacetylase BshB2 n=1 Tax=Thalassobacillus sp. CUG 92003 TaxID=2736641 RepID=UPI0015E6798B|nr:bacillithiol biosynthesis deacetylase BshB2 [Thalassobacillus sp. CUG 92003]